MYKVTQKDIETVQALKEKGATDKVCYEALGVSKNTWLKHKKGLFEPPIKTGSENRSQSLLEIAEDSLPKQLTGYFVEEEEKRVNPVTGKFELYSTKKKWMAPNATLMMFTTVNAQNAVNGKISWQSINKVENTTLINNVPKIEIEWTKEKNEAKS